MNITIRGYTIPTKLTLLTTQSGNSVERRTHFDNAFNSNLYIIAVDNGTDRSVFDLVVINVSFVIQTNIRLLFTLKTSNDIRLVCINVVLLIIIGASSSNRSIQPIPSGGWVPLSIFPPLLSIECKQRTCEHFFLNFDHFNQC